MAITDSTVPFCLEQCPILYQLYGKMGQSAIILLVHGVPFYMKLSRFL